MHRIHSIICNTLLTFISLCLVFSQFPSRIVHALEENSSFERVMKETGEYHTVYKNVDGTNTVQYYNEPIRFYDESGSLKDIDTSLKGNDKNGYTTVSAPVNAFFHLETSQDIRLSYKATSVFMRPVKNDEKGNIVDYTT